MKQQVGAPPNVDLIRMVLGTIPQDAVFTYGDTIYKMMDVELPEDVLSHEKVHEKQQGNKVDIWWKNWLENKVFRYQQELEAYAHQYKSQKDEYSAVGQKQYLMHLANQLKTHYGLDVSLQEVESKIRNMAK